MAATPDIVDGSPWAAWLTPPFAVSILTETYGSHTDNLAKTVLLNRLRGGVLLARSGKYVVTRDVRQYVLIPQHHWDAFDTLGSFWRSGEADYEMRDLSGIGRLRHRVYDVRFEPRGFHEIVVIAASGTKLEGEFDPNRESGDSPTAAGREKKPISPAALKAWYEAYKKVYGGTPTDTLPFAHESAKGMFPDKFVSRDAIRDLAGGRKPGRKPATD